MRRGKSRDRQREALRAARDQQQCQHEQQVIDAEQDVLHAEAEIAPGHLAASRHHGNRQRRLRRRQPCNPLVAIGKLDPDQGVGHGPAQTLDVQRSTAQRLV